MRFVYTNAMLAIPETDQIFLWKPPFYKNLPEEPPGKNLPERTALKEVSRKVFPKRTLMEGPPVKKYLSKRNVLCRK